MKSFFSVFILLFSFALAPLAAQSESSTVDSLNNNLFDMSNRYTENGTIYRVVKWDVLSAYFAEIKVEDKFKADKIAESQLKIDQLSEASKLQHASYDELQAKYDTAIKENDSMSFFSLLIPKAQYNLIMWGLVLVLVVCLVILFMMYGRSASVTRLAKNELAEKVEEFESYRKRTLKREQEVASGYLRDIKKLKDQLG